MNAVSIERDGYTIIETTHEPRIDWRNLDTYRFEHLIHVKAADDAGTFSNIFVGYGPTPEAAQREAEAEAGRWQESMARINAAWPRRELEAVS